MNKCANLNIYKSAQINSFEDLSSINLKEKLMKKTKSNTNHHKVHFGTHSFFERNIGTLGLVVVILFLVVYMVLNKMDSMNTRIVELESGSQNGNQQQMPSEN